MSKKKKIQETLTAYILLFPYLAAFFLFITIPTLVAVGLSFTDYNLVSAPHFVGLQNYITIFTGDELFWSKIIPNTLTFVVFVGIGGYLLSFALAWVLAQIPHTQRKIISMLLYLPSMTLGIAVSVIWAVLFSGDVSGYLNAWLLGHGMIEEPVQWLTNPDYILTIMIIVSLWSSMGIGFLAMLSGILSINPELYEAAYMDGISNKWQEVTQITIPAMKPQMLFGAIMSLVSTFNAGMIGVQLTGSNPTPDYAGQLLVNHIDDAANIRYEMGYAAALSVILLLIVYLLSKVAFYIFREKED